MSLNDYNRSFCILECCSLNLHKCPIYLNDLIITMCGSSLMYVFLEFKKWFKDLLGHYILILMCLSFHSHTLFM